MDPAAIREKYGIERVIKLASNENPLGTSPLVQHTLETHVGLAFRYPQAGNPRLVKAIAAHHGVSPSRIIVGDGSDEVIDLLFRICVEPGVNNAVAFMPCFGIYTTQAACAAWSCARPGERRLLVPVGQPAQAGGRQDVARVRHHADNRPGTRLRWRNSKRWRRRCPTPACSCWTKLHGLHRRRGGLLAGEAAGRIPQCDHFAHVLQELRHGRAPPRYAIVPEELADHYWRVRLPSR